MRGLFLGSRRRQGSTRSFANNNRMKLLGVLLLCAFAAAVPTAIQKIDIGVEIPEDALETPASRNILINILIRQLFTYIRYVINNGSAVFGLPPMDPLVIEDYHLYLPSGLVNLDLELKNAKVTGIGGFVVHTSNFVPSEMSFDLEISVPSIVIEAEHYDMVGDILMAIPLYGTGTARFQLDNFRFKGKLILKQSDDGKSVLVDKVLNAGYIIPYFRSQLTGVIGGGDIDKVVNSVIQDVLVDYSNRFQGAVAALAGAAIPAIANPALEQLDTWKYIDRFV